MTLSAQGATTRRDSRFNRPASSRASRYFISPACPWAIHCGKYASSSKSRTGAMPAKSNPASCAARFTSNVISLIPNKAKHRLKRSLQQKRWPKATIEDFAFSQRPTTNDQRPSLNTQLLHFLVVVLPVKDVPLLTAFEDGALLTFDFLAGGLVDARFLVQQFFENLACFQPDGVTVFEELHLRRIRKRVANHVGKLVHFIAAQSHCTSSKVLHHRVTEKTKKGFELLCAPVSLW